jgi:hypothetical protein
VKEKNTYMNISNILKKNFLNLVKFMVFDQVTKKIEIKNDPILNLNQILCLKKIELNVKIFLINFD